MSKQNRAARKVVDWLMSDDQLPIAIVARAMQIYLSELDPFDRNRLLSDTRLEGIVQWWTKETLN